MLKKIAITFALAMAAGTVFAAGSPADGVNIGMDSDMPVNMQFDVLDSNDDGTISRYEAQASPELSAMYDSFNTHETIEEQARKASVNGITLAQFQAGVHAMGEGVMGPAVYGGGTYVLMKNGNWVRRDKVFKTPADAR